MKKLSKRKKKHKNRHRSNWHRLSHSTVVVNDYFVDKEEINAIAMYVFGGLNVSVKDL